MPLGIEVRADDLHLGPIERGAAGARERAHAHAGERRLGRAPGRPVDHLAVAEGEAVPERVLRGGAGRSGLFRGGGRLCAVPESAWRLGAGPSRTGWLRAVPGPAGRLRAVPRLAGRLCVVRRHDRALAQRRARRELRHRGQQGGAAERVDVAAVVERVVEQHPGPGDAEREEERHRGAREEDAAPPPVRAARQVGLVEDVELGLALVLGGVRGQVRGPLVGLNGLQVLARPLQIEAEPVPLGLELDHALLGAPVGRPRLRALRLAPGRALRRRARRLAPRRRPAASGVRAQARDLPEERGPLRRERRAPRRRERARLARLADRRLGDARAHEPERALGRGELALRRLDAALRGDGVGVDRGHGRELLGERRLGRRDRGDGGGAGPLRLDDALGQRLPRRRRWRPPGPEQRLDPGELPLERRELRVDRAGRLRWRRSARSRRGRGDAGRAERLGRRRIGRVVEPPLELRIPGEERRQRAARRVDLGAGLGELLPQEIAGHRRRAEAVAAVVVEQDLREAGGDLLRHVRIVVGERDDVRIAALRAEADVGLHLLDGLDHRAGGLLRVEPERLDDAGERPARGERVLELRPEARRARGAALGIAAGLDGVAVEDRGLAPPHPLRGERQREGDRESDGHHRGRSAPVHPDPAEDADRAIQALAGCALRAQAGHGVPRPCGQRVQRRAARRARAGALRPRTARRVLAGASPRDAPGSAPPRAPAARARPDADERHGHSASGERGSLRGRSRKAGARRNRPAPTEAGSPARRALVLVTAAASSTR
ncbi:hypothetical protein predicted by Glimmer/Critica [Sorangium cellulosum So ce56]|uniref:Uncharacterized protein n=1 Tax=Sorangium cellulosum (strain So ce56) TaxID=448385 RepID=A9GID4_SORC5|nr:hypothetical protein predicted by Glimmer/Critica [Sorangium cellulosum So ce56]